MTKLSFVLFAGITALVSLQQASASDLVRTREKIVYSFCSQQGCADGASPDGRLLNVAGKFYGTTQLGGAAGLGVVFALDAKTGIQTVLYAFCSEPNCSDGAVPFGRLIDLNGLLYGTTGYGGAYNGGTVFTIDPNTGAKSVFYSFGSHEDGTNPAGLIEANGTLYGTTVNARGAAQFGTVYALNPTVGKATVLHYFCNGPDCKDGSDPVGDLLYVNGVIYGTTLGGGQINNFPSNFGTVFSLDPLSGAAINLHSFNGQDGALARGDLIGVQGTLYGTTEEGGDNGAGTVFALDPKSGAETVLYSFCSQPECTDGSYPQAGLIDLKGSLYGTTLQGGTNCTTSRPPGCGTVFSVDPKTRTETVIYSFDNPKHVGDGRYPNANLIEAHGALYGTTWAGGAYNAGTVFVIRHP